MLKWILVNQGVTVWNSFDCLIVSLQSDGGLLCNMLYIQIVCVRGSFDDNGREHVFSWTVMVLHLQVQSGGCILF
jgi:hypothetical protein